MLADELKIDRDYIVNRVPILYKYIKCEGFFSMLHNSKLMFKNPSDFNDPYDCYKGLINFKKTDNFRQYVISSLNQINSKNTAAVLERLNSMSDYEICRIFTDILLPDQLSKIGITCFSENYRNFLMWSHYSDSHKGICVGFNRGQLITDLREFIPTLFKVKYCNAFEKMDYTLGDSYAFLHCFRTKSADWAYEKEIRIVLFNLTFNEDKQSFIRFGKEAISEIYLGSKIEPQDENDIRSLCKKDYPITKIYKMELDNYSFNLIPKEIG